MEASTIHTIYTEENLQLAFAKTEETINYWPFVLWTTYGLGVLLFSVKFFRNLFSIIKQIRENPKCRDGSFVNILLEENVIPHTFFSYIFLNKRKFESGNIPAEVMLHEEAHARQIHSLDIILIEILKIVFWFNPLFYWLKRSIKLNHEFLADQAVLQNGIEPSVYQNLLLTFSNSGNSREILTPSLANSINYSSIKKRFIIMKKNTSRRAILFRSLLLLPLLSFLVLGFSSMESIEEQASNDITLINGTIEDIQIKIDENSKISLNGSSVTISNLKGEINKLNAALTVEEKQKYLSAYIEIEDENFKELAEKVGEVLYTCDIRSWQVTNIKAQINESSKLIYQKYSMAGKTVEEAEVLYQEHLKEVEKFEKERSNAKKDENNPWSVKVIEHDMTDKKTQKKLQKEK